MSPSILIGLNLLGLVAVYFLVRKSVLRRIERGILRDRMARDVGELVATINRSADESVTILENRIRVARELSRRLEEVARYLEKLPDPKSVADTSHAAVQINPDGHAEPGRDSGENLPGQQDGTPASLGGNDPEEIREQVLSLHRDGVTPERISDRLGIPVGQVELIVALAALGSQR